MTKIAQASYSEYYGAWGEPGNQLRQGTEDGELNIVEYTHFTRCFRWKDRSLAANAADLAVRIVRNKLVGYSQNNGASPRDTLHKELVKCGWMPEKIQSKCNCDCSSFVAVLCQYNGLNIPDSMYTGSECQLLAQTGAFEDYEITGDFVFAVGDIVWREGHTAIVVEADDFKPDLVTTGNVNMRVQPVDGKIIKALPPGTGVKLVAENPWYKVTDGKNTGWMSGLYLEKT